MIDVIWDEVGDRVAPSSSNILPSDNMSRFSSTPPSQGFSPNTPERTHSSPQNNRITIKNRRKKYLDTHPTYFLSPSLELAGLFLPSHHMYYVQLRIRVDKSPPQVKRPIVVRPAHPALPEPGRKKRGRREEGICWSTGGRSVEGRSETGGAEAKRWLLKLGDGHTKWG